MTGHDPFELVGTTIADKFRVERVLGEGGFGVVYAGMHVTLGERVAIKCLKPEGFSAEDNARAAQAFLREGRILFGLGHPAIVRLYDVGIIESRQIPYVVLELLNGKTLEAEIASRAGARRHFSRDEILALFTPMLEAVAFAHERGIVHRDLKPSNIMLVDEGGRLQPKVLDFGTARDDVAGTGRAGRPAESMGRTVHGTHATCDSASKRIAGTASPRVIASCPLSSPGVRAQLRPLRAPAAAPRYQGR